MIDAYLAEANVADSSPLLKQWYLDSGASNHVSGDPSVFSSLSPRSGTRITSAGGHSHDVTRVGNIVIRLPTGEMQQISHVLYLPGITKNLILVGFLADKFTLEFWKALCLIKMGGSIIATAIRNPANGLYRLQGDTILGCHEVPSAQPKALALMSAPCNASTWHKRLGHFHYQGIRRMIKFGAVHGLPQMSIRNFHYSSCLTGKQSRKSISKVRSHESTEILELVHSDVAGPFRIQSLRGARYFVTFIDNFSRKTWVYFMTSKDQVFEKFKLFLYASERLSGKKLKILRSDNGGEYVSKIFLSYCSNAGITRQYSQSYTPQHNGIAERRNRFLLDIVRSLLSDSLLPNHLWAEVVRAACVIMNLRSSKAHLDKTSDEIFSGTKPSVSHL